jgi:hypothetical protein
MRYLPSSIAAGDTDIAAAPYFGGEFAIYLSYVAAKFLGSVTLTGAGAGALVKSTANTIVAATDIQVVARTPIVSPGGNVVLTLAMHDNSGTPISMNGVATFAPPTRAADQSGNFPRGYAVDLIPATSGKMYTSLDTLGSVTFGAANLELDIYQLPVLTDYNFIGCVRDFDFNTKSRMAKGIDCGMEADAFVKRGKTQPGEITIGDKLKGFAEGLARYDGGKLTLMAVGIKDGQVTGDRLVFTQFVPTTKNKLPEGDGEAVSDAVGKFVEHLFFVAP